MDLIYKQGLANPVLDLEYGSAMNYDEHVLYKFTITALNP